MRVPVGRAVVKNVSIMGMCTFNSVVQLEQCGIPDGQTRMYMCSGVNVSRVPQQNVASLFVPQLPSQSS